MADSPYDAYSSDPTVYLYTSLTAGSSHIITATSRLETILKANKIPFRAIDVATDDKARMLWGRRAKGKKLPGLVRHGMIVGDLAQIEEWNEFGELKMQIGSSEGGGSTAPAAPTTSAPKTAAPSMSGSAQPSASTSTTPASTGTTPAPTSTAPHVQIGDTPSRTSSAASNKEKDEHRYTTALRQAGEEAASKAKENQRSKLGVQPTSSLSKAEEAVAQTAATSEEPTTTKDAEKKEKEEAEDSDKKDQLKPTEEKKDDNESPAETAEAKAEVKEKEDAADAAESLKAAQRRASVQADVQGSNAEVAVVDSATDLQELKANAESTPERRREPEVSATSAAEKEEVAKDLRRGSVAENEVQEQGTGNPTEKAVE